MFGNVLVCGGRGFHIHIRIPVESNGKRGTNSDGKFSTTNEGIAANKIKLYCDGTIVNPVMGDNGKYMYSLNAGNYNYKLVYDLPNGICRSYALAASCKSGYK